MKKKRIWALAICFAVFFSILPVQPLHAEENIVQYYYKASYTCGAYSSYANYGVQITAVIDRSALKADVVFERDDIGEYAMNQLLENYPDDAEYIKRFYGQTRCHATCDVEDFHNDDGNNGKYDYHLDNFVWDDDPFLLYIDSYKDGDEIKAKLVDKPIAYINISHVKAGSNGGKSDFGIYGKEGKAYSYTSYHGIWYNQTPKEPAPKVEKEVFKMKHDSFSFVNAFDSFYKTQTGETSESTKIYKGKEFANGTRGFLLDDTSYNALIKGRDKNQIAAINIWLRCKWTGDCVGMSTMSGLLYEGKIGLNKVGGGSETYALTSPVNNKQLASFIEFYQFKDNFDRKRYINLNRKNLPSSKESALEVVKMLQDDPMTPVVFHFSFSENENGKKVWYGHAVLAYKVVSTMDFDELTVYDPNEPEKEEYITITKDGKASFKKYGDDIYVKPGERAKDVYDAEMDYPEISFSFAVVKVNGSVELTADGRTVIISGGDVAGDLEVEPEKEVGSDDLTILVPLSSERKLRIIRHSGTYASVETQDTTAVISDGATEMTISGDGTVTAKTNGTKGSLGVASNKTKGDILGTTVESKAGEIEITPTDEGAKIKTNEGTGDITVSGMNGNEDFGDIDTSKGIEVKKDGNRTVITSQGQEIGNGTENSNQDPQNDPNGDPQNDPQNDPPVDPDNGSGSKVTNYTVKFDSDGGSSVSDISVRKGDKINPLPTTSKTGYKFEGWYLGSQMWTTSLPVDSDMTLKAKWTVKEVRKELKAAKGQKKQTVKVSKTYKGEKISLNVDMVCDKKITYTGEKLGAEDLNFKIDLGDLYDIVNLSGGSVKAEDLFKVSYVGKNNLNKSTSSKKAQIYAKVTFDETKAKNAGLGNDEIARIKSVVKALNKNLKNKPCTYTIKALKLKAKGVTVQPIVVWNGKKVNVLAVRVTFKENGEEKTCNLPASQFKIKVANTSKKTVKVTGKGNCSGTVTVKGYAESELWKYSSTGALLSDMKDKTGYEPKDWSWKAEGEGYGKKYFTSGKYVRADSLAVIYIDSTESPDGFYFQAFSKASGARQSDYTTYDSTYDTPNIWLSLTDEKTADDGTWHIRSFGNGTIEVTTNWLDEMYLMYEDPAGIYYLVRELV